MHAEASAHILFGDWIWSQFHDVLIAMSPEFYCSERKSKFTVLQRSFTVQSVILLFRLQIGVLDFASTEHTKKNGGGTP